MKTFDQIKTLITLTQASRKNKQADAGKCLNLIITRILNLKKGNKIFFLGNGGSASIASHMTVDFLKNAEIPAISFNDPSIITCISNDLGYEKVFEKPIQVLAQKNDIVFAISSSGKSKNILNAALAAKSKGCFLITLSGFNPGNPLRKLGDVNFYSPSHAYGDVESVHLIICHNIADSVIKQKNG